MKNQLSLPTFESVLADAHSNLMLEYVKIRTAYRADKITKAESRELIAAAVISAYKDYEDRVLNSSTASKAVISAIPADSDPYAIHTLDCIGPATEEYADITDD